MSIIAEQSDADHTGIPQPFADPAEFKEMVEEMVTDQAPRVFAVVLEYGEQVDAQVAAWGMALDESAYVIATDGKNQYVLASPENALKDVRCPLDTTPHLVWATRSTPE